MCTVCHYFPVLINSVEVSCSLNWCCWFCLRAMNVIVVFDHPYSSSVLRDCKLKFLVFVLCLTDGGIVNFLLL